MTWDGESYQRRIDTLAASGALVHGEADFVAALHPTTVLDAGCGTGRVTRELAQRGIEAVGIDPDPSMIATARRLSPDLTWVEADMTGLDLGRVFDAVVMAGNVPLFTPPGTQAALVDGCARHLRPHGTLVAGFQLDGRYSVVDYDRHCRGAGLELVERWASWDRLPFPGPGTYAVSVHRART
ncbi:MAG TPA: class I SAM-dependent methyltransferase [Acidimicrobiales bacterium]|nr:class I SAM-dependent methyltransferase [Acidimicrobiales bacterium]